MKLENVTFSYDKSRVILDNISFSTVQGEHIGIVGANGAGKTTMLKLMVGLLMVQGGRISVGDITVARDTLPQIRKHIGYVFQDSDSQLFMPTVVEDVMILKGFYTVLAAYLLAATCSAERICLALEILHVPRMIVTQIMLMYRYIFLFLGEVGRISQAYALRAPGQKGIHFKAWGALVGQLLLRSIDRAGRVYESMLLRGFNGSFSVFRQKERLRLRDAAFGLFWAAVLILFRSVPVVVEVGNAVTASFGAR